jgi:hypothetical protein
MEQELHRFKLAALEASDRISPGARVILIDQDELDPSFLDERRIVKFPERDGLYNGPPADGKQAIEELTRALQDRPAYVVVAWTAFWWLDYYSEINKWLKLHSQPILVNDRLMIFWVPPER